MQEKFLPNDSELPFAEVPNQASTNPGYGNDTKLRSNVVDRKSWGSRGSRGSRGRESYLFECNFV
jgi:hypothetical protein